MHRGSIGRRSERHDPFAVPTYEGAGIGVAPNHTISAAAFGSCAGPSTEEVELDIETDARGAFTLMKLTGKLDTLSSPTLQTHLSAAIEACEGGVVVDMENISFVSSAGLRVMLIGAKASKAKNKVFRLAGLKPVVADVFKMTGFDRLIDVYETADAALNA